MLSDLMETNIHSIAPQKPWTILKNSSVPGQFHRLRSVIRRVCTPYWKWRFARFGPGSTLSSPSLLVGTSCIEIGSRVRIWHSGRLEAIRTETSIGRIIIGDDTTIQPYVHIGAVMKVEIGKGVLMASGVYISDHDHCFQDPYAPPVSNQTVVACPVAIGDFVWLGQRSMVLKGVRIGEHSVIGAGAVVSKDIPAYCVAVGSPARVIRRYSFSQRRWIPVAEIES